MTDKERYEAAVHAMQSGVAMKMNYDGTETEPKHLRVALNAALVEHSALAGLLVAKGLITDDEYVKALADAMEAEKRRYEAWLRERLGSDSITLG